ncbi:hypothetical protein ACN9ML_11530 [Dyadobacter endophyticus]|uniref:hypothetical protein n=1 Tax=Dyadobacter endophyticus TaxID=1749036 RepID=UPI003CF46A03
MESLEINSLAQEGSFQGMPLNASLLQTHISWVLLSGNRAFKIKKPVKLSFLDFSTIQARKLACEKELEVNRRFSPIYQGVLPVGRAGNTFCIGGAGSEIVDYAVMMRRLSSARKMDAMLAAGKVESTHIVSLAKLVASFHRSAEVVSLPLQLSEMAATFDDITTVSGFVAEHLGTAFGKLIEHAVALSTQFLTTYLPRMNERVRLGFRRDLHGDLHSGNVFLYKKPILFDCIEYNDRFRQIDVLDEIAFLCMDLECFGRYSLSEMFLSLYCEDFPCFQTESDNLIFVYYKCLRANIRAKVFAVTAMTAPNDKSRQKALGLCKKYLDLLSTYSGQLAMH